jgi:Fe-S cluster assembly protein SufB
MEKSTKNSNSNVVLDDIVASPYKYGFKTDIETENFPKGLSKAIVNLISQKKMSQNS